MRSRSREFSSSLKNRKKEKLKTPIKEANEFEYQESTKRSASESSKPQTRSRRATSNGNSVKVKVSHERRFFNLREDSIILAYWLEHKQNSTTIKISNILSKELTHSAEAIRDRIKRYLSRLSNFDHEYILDEAEVRNLKTFAITESVLMHRNSLVIFFTLKIPKKANHLLGVES